MREQKCFSNLFSLFFKKKTTFKWRILQNCRTCFSLCWYLFLHELTCGGWFLCSVNEIHFNGSIPHKNIHLFVFFFYLQCNETSFFFEARNKVTCKHLWKCCVEHHTFFRWVKQKLGCVFLGATTLIGSLVIPAEWWNKALLSGNKFVLLVIECF